MNRVRPRVRIPMGLMSLSVPVLLGGMGAAIGAAQASPKVTRMDFKFLDSSQHATEVPRDGVSTRAARVYVYWQGAAAPGEKVTVGFSVQDGVGTFEPETVEVPLTANPVVADATYRQPAQPSSKDREVIAQAACRSMTDVAALMLRGVALDAVSGGPDELYSGTETGRACSHVCVRAYCPGNLALQPQGKIYASAAGVGGGVYLKWYDEEAQRRKWARRHAEPLRSAHLPVPGSRLRQRVACFTIATDCPGGLPSRPMERAVASFLLNSRASPVNALLTVKVLVPVKVRIEWESAGWSVRKGRKFRGTIAWFADEEETKFYWGAKGTMQWQLPDGQQTHTYHLSKAGARPYAFSSQQTHASGHGTFYLTEEHGVNFGGLPVWVGQPLAKRVEPCQRLWERAFQLERRPDSRVTVTHLLKF